MRDHDEAEVGASAGAPFLILAWALLAGGAGVALAAVAAHRVASPALETAATMLMIHAAAAVGLIAVAGRYRLSRVWLWSVTLMLAAVSLFSGDIAVHTLANVHLFPMAAPTGGTLLIAAWLALAILAVIQHNGRR